jgi:hypothetical protein
MSIDDFDNEKDYKSQLIKDLLEICEELGWSVAIPDTEEDEEVPGLIIGNPEYIEKVLDAVDQAEEDSDAGNA